MPDKTPLEMALEREGQIDYCDECEYVRVVGNAVFCGLSGKLLHPMMFLRGQGCGPARCCTKRKEAREMGLTAADLARLGPGAQRQILAKLAKPPAAPEKRQKYGNRKAKRIMPNSEKEARRYDELTLLLKAGRIQNLRLQQDFTLAEAFVKPSGEAVRAERYKADFTYYRDGVFIVEDVKGYRTQDYINKRKAMYEKYGIEVTEI